MSLKQAVTEVIVASATLIDRVLAYGYAVITAPDY
jgi:hypothetical protein